MANPLPYYLGLALWANPHWKGKLLRKNAKPGEFLSQYAQVYNAVEGNTTFYAVPSAENVQRWLAATPDYFRFSFKFPKTITHQQHLQHVEQASTEFLQRLSPLGERINGLMVQLPAGFSPLELGQLERFLKQLPNEYQYAVEVRHPAFFTDAVARQALNDLLQSLNVDRVILDSRPVHAAPIVDEPTREAKIRKPRLPVQLDVTANQPVLRYIGHPIVADNQAWLERWVAQTARWIAEGKTPRIYLHTPSNDLAPDLALLFHKQLQMRVPNLADLAPFPGLIGNGI
ncbi:MAG: DUF72 domain-containing protein [Candidatus Thiocaldithrix dubininis]|uniref:DUF72 domain-containing protein n=1 Tax=Candidatus Thiocaldithrix dubininis TaxID=3080823 RepID=A0AA95H598_9GAMM|nr:MAG: DUF72 domain-containing protein [Candidatus Thiocaldithrix dubininis]